MVDFWNATAPDSADPADVFLSAWVEEVHRLASQDIATAITIAKQEIQILNDNSTELRVWCGENSLLGFEDWKALIDPQNPFAAPGSAADLAEILARQANKVEAISNAAQEIWFRILNHVADVVCKADKGWLIIDEHSCFVGKNADLAGKISKRLLRHVCEQARVGMPNLEVDSSDLGYGGRLGPGDLSLDK